MTLTEKQQRIVDTSLNHSDLHVDYVSLGRTTGQRREQLYACFGSIFSPEHEYTVRDITAMMTRFFLKSTTKRNRYSAFFAPLAGISDAKVANTNKPVMTHMGEKVNDYLVLCAVLGAISGEHSAKSNEQVMAWNIVDNNIHDDIVAFMDYVLDNTVEMNNNGVVDFMRLAFTMLSCTADIDTMYACDMFSVLVPYNASVVKYLTRRYAMTASGVSHREKSRVIILLFFHCLKGRGSDGSTVVSAMSNDMMYRLLYSCSRLYYSIKRAPTENFFTFDDMLALAPMWAQYIVTAFGHHNKILCSTQQIMDVLEKPCENNHTNYPDMLATSAKRRAQVVNNMSAPSRTLKSTAIDMWFFVAGFSTEQQWAFFSSHATQIIDTMTSIMANYSGNDIYNVLNNADCTTVLETDDYDGAGACMFPTLVTTVMEELGEDTQAWAETIVLMFALDATTVADGERIGAIVQQHSDLIDMPLDWASSLVPANH